MVTPPCPAPISKNRVIAGCFFGGGGWGVLGEGEFLTLNYPPTQDVVGSHLSSPYTTLDPDSSDSNFHQVFHTFSSPSWGAKIKLRRVVLPLRLHILLDACCFFGFNLMASCHMTDSTKELYPPPPPLYTPLFSHGHRSPLLVLEPSFALRFNQDNVRRKRCSSKTSGEGVEPWPPWGPSVLNGTTTGRERSLAPSTTRFPPL